MTQAVKDLAKFAKKAGLRIADKGNGHYQIIGGPLLVNYYPESKSMTAYVAGMKGSFKHVLPEKAVQMAFIQPDPISKRDNRSRQEKNIKHKQEILRKHPYCHWCRKPLTIKDATLEHIIPLSIGGLNNRNNMTVACHECNQNRGCNMPELGVTL